VLAAARARGAGRDYFETGQRYLEKLSASNTGRFPGNDAGKVNFAPDFDAPLPEFER
jgi:hypothetical protein